MKGFYITTTLPYVNDRPHVGHALEFVQADAFARAKRLEGYDVFLNFGTDEHGQKVYEKALESGKSPQAYADERAATFDALKEALNFSYDKFIRTTDPEHKAAAQEFWKICAKNGDIYKKFYKIKYCVGCELEKTDSELTDGKCPIHPNLEVEMREEENYFFRFSKHEKSLKELYLEQPGFVLPAFRLNEIKSLIEGEGLQDFSISRLKEKMPWGIQVPEDDKHIMYVWFDALINYISTIGWPKDMTKFERYWPVVQFAGKDQVRQQAAMWQAMLFSVGLPPSKQIIIHGFIIGEGGVKMSKSLGNVIDPYKIVEEYGTDALRYFLLRHIHPFEDSEFTSARFKEAYNAHLANGLGNLVSRIMKMSSDYGVTANLPNKEEVLESDFSAAVFDNLEKHDYNSALDMVWSEIQNLDSYINIKAPFKLVKQNPEEAKAVVAKLIEGLWSVAVILEPFLPSTAVEIQRLIGANSVPAKPLFPRKD